MTIDIPTSVSARERAVLRRYCTGRNVVELGTLLGASSVFMSQYAASVITLDRHCDYGPPTWRTLRRNISMYHATKICALRGDIFADQWLEFFGIPDEFAFIDLTGCHNVTRRALELVHDIPVVAVHDITRSYCRGAERALKACGRPTLEHVDTLVVLGQR